MESIPNWYFDEKSQVGVDYADGKIVENYDTQHTKFRDYAREASRIINTLNLKSSNVVLDMGCGSGGITIPLARHCKKVYAVDISEKMVELCRQKSLENNISNITTNCSGFLTYKHSGEELDAIISTAVLHHLPDFWKVIALRNMHKILKPGGKFFLFDVVFSFPPDEYQSFINNWIQNVDKMAGQKMREETITHIKEEYSTWDWILDKMLDAAGFNIELKTSEMPNTQIYLCSKKG
jgi:putative AdoMet-dependent methyltransferase